MVFGDGGEGLMEVNVFMGFFFFTKNSWPDID